MSFLECTLSPWRWPPLRRTVWEALPTLQVSPTVRLVGWMPLQIRARCSAKLALVQKVVQLHAQAVGLDHTPCHQAPLLSSCQSKPKLPRHASEWDYWSSKTSPQHVSGTQPIKRVVVLVAVRRLNVSDVERTHA
jgi:hypothetical protein